MRLYLGMNEAKTAAMNEMVASVLQREKDFVRARWLFNESEGACNIRPLSGGELFAISQAPTVG